MSIRILLADDHKIVREGLGALIEQQSGMEVVAQAEDGRTAVELARKLYPDVVIMDIGMPELNGVEATRQILALVSRVRVIALSMHSDRRFVGEMLRAGASGYLLKDCAFEELDRAVRTVISNRIYLSPGITGVVVEDYLHPSRNRGKGASPLLTSREREVLQLLAEGKSTKQIAFDLNLSGKTIETHRQRIMKKLKLHAVADLTKYAIRTGLTSLQD